MDDGMISKYLGKQESQQNVANTHETKAFSKFLFRYANFRLTSD